MKKVLAVILAIFIMVGLTACGSTGGGPSTSSDTPASTSNSPAPSTDTPDTPEKPDDAPAGTDDELPTDIQRLVDDIDYDNAEDVGMCGTNAMWYYSNGILVIRGTGEVNSYSIGESGPWHKYYNDLNMLVVEPGITGIGYRAFADMYVLNRVYLPDGFESLGGQAFRHCAQLEVVRIPNTLSTIEGCVFQECASLAQIKLPEGLTTIEVATFSDCALTSIELSEGLTTIEVEAFNRCPFTSITIPASVTSVESFGDAKTINLECDASALTVSYDKESDLNYIEGLWRYGKGDPEITINYSGSGYEEIIEQFPNFNWVKQ